MKKQYIVPSQTIVEVINSSMIAASDHFTDPTTSSQSVSVTEEEYDGEFNTRQFGWSQEFYED